MVLIPHNRRPRPRSKLRACRADWPQSLERNALARSGSIGTIAKRLVILALLAGSVLLLLRLATDNSSAQSTSSNATPAAAKTKAIADAYGRLELSFIPNKGQTDQRVKFVSHGPGYDLFLTDTEAVLTLRKPRALTSENLKQPSSHKDAGVQPQPATVLRLKMIGTEKDPRVSGVDELQGKVNYFVSNDPSAWQVNVPTYRKVNYAGIFPGVDLVYYGNRSQLEYDFIVAPGADISSIKFEVEGAEAIKVGAEGELHLLTKQGDVQLCKPQLYQLNQFGAREYVDGHYVVKGRQIGFKVAAFDNRKPLVIDPVLSYSTLLGTAGSEYGNSIAVDSQGNAYITGVTNSGGFPTTAGAFQTTGGFGGAFISKLDATGSNLVYSTYLAGASGTGQTVGTGIAVDSAGDAYVAGYTSSSDFPTLSPLRGGRNNLLITTNSGGNWAPNNIGTGNRSIQALAIDKNSPSTIYAGTGLNGGLFKSTDGGASWAALNTGLTNASCNAIAIHPTNSNLLYAALVAQNFGPGTGVYKSVDGGNTWTNTGLNQQVFSLAVDPQNPLNVYAGSNFGFSKSTNGGASWANSSTGMNFGGANAIVIDPATPSTIYTIAGGGGVFKSINSAGNWSQVNNGLTNTTLRGLVMDPAVPSTLYVGSAGGGIFKTTDAGGSWSAVNNGPALATANISSLAIVPGSPATLFAGTFDGRIFKTTNAGASWITVYTTTTNTGIRALAVDASAPAKIVAGVDSTSPTMSTDAFVAKLNPSGSGLVYSTLLGGLLTDQANAIAIDASGSALITGFTSSLDYPTVNPTQSTFNGPTNCSVSGDAILTKLNPSGTAISYSTFLGGSGCDTARAIALDNSGKVYITGETSSPGFGTPTAFQQALASAPFGRDAFVARFYNAGISEGLLEYFTYLGGTGDELGYGIAADNSGNAYVTGLTTSSNFPTANPIQATNGGSAGDVFVTKINSTGSGLVYSTYLGGSAIEAGRGIALDSAGNAYVTGFTGSSEFPLVAGALRTKSPFSKSIDGGASWNNDNYGLKSDIVTAIAVNPVTPSTLFAGSRSSVFKSTDSGRNWAPSMTGLVTPSVTSFAINPANPLIMYLSSNLSNFSGSSTGVFKSADGGNTWTAANNGLGNGGITYVVIDPLTPSTLYAGTGFSIYKSTNSGGTWNQISPLFSSDVLAIDPVNPTTLYSAVSPANGGGKVSKSTDGGATWQVVGNGYTGSGAGFLAINPQTPSTVYASGFNGGLFKTVDGGANWISINVGIGGPIAIDPSNPSIVYGSSSGAGVFKSTNGGSTWSPANNGLRVQFVSALAINPTSSAVYAGVNAFTSDDDAFVTKINAAGTSLIYSTLLGGTRAPLDSINYNDSASAIAVDVTGNAYITGLSRSPDFPVSPDAYQPFYRGFDEAFVAKLATSYIISGQVLDGSNAPVSGVEIVLNDGASLTSVTTEADGSYQFSRLREGGNFTVTAAKPGFTIAPASHTFNNLTADQTANFTATATNAAFPTISGQITENGSPLAGVNVTLSGSQVGVRTTDASGNYSFTLASGGNYTVTPAKLAFTFTPPSQTFNNLTVNQAANFAGTRQNFVVTNANDHGAGSLRQAMLDANATVGLDTIVFNIPGAGVKTINLLLALPEITDAVVIDATTQPGYAGTPLVELNGSAAGASANGFFIKAGGSTIKGFAIGRFSDGYGIWIYFVNNNTIQANYIGVDATGTIRRANRTGILLSGSNNNLIGGTTSAARNVLSGNIFEGIEMGGSNNLIQGNFIGTNAAGTAALGNGAGGVRVSGSPFALNVVGGTVPGAGNLISGNQRGVYSLGPGTLIQGNLIGTDVTGTQAIANGTGVEAQGIDNVVGGTVPGARNIISGNTQGVYISGTGSKLQGNFVGTDITGTIALGNTDGGVFGGNQALIGGTTPEARNVISGNGGNGNVSLNHNIISGTVTVQGNYIGTDVTGNVALANPTFGILVSGNNIVIGGPTSSAANVISGHTVGIQIGGLTTANLTGSVVQGNIIGLNAAGNVPLQNLSGGIVLDNASNNTIGGPAAGAANIIAFSGGPGVKVNSGTGNVIQGNSIFSNLGLGIDLSPDGVTLNDSLDADTGANNLQNWPQLTSVSPSGGGTLIQGTLHSKPSTLFRIDFYSNSACHSSGNGEGGRFFDTTNVTTDASGNATINFTSSLTLAGGKVLTATATDPSGNTSEFSACDSTNAAGSVAFENYSNNVLEDVGTAAINVVRTGGSKGTLSINYSSVNGTATAGSDYTAVSGSLVFADGETTKTILLPIANDGVTEPDETLRIFLTGYTDLETLGFSPVTTVTIQDNNTQLYIFSTTVLFEPPGFIDFPEGDSGTTNRTVFFRLSAQTSRTVSVDFNSQGSTATSGVDFGAVNGTLTFAPTVTKRTVTVPIIGDTLDEPNETFAIVLSNPVNAALAQTFATVRILDDDPLPVLTISDASITEGNSGTTTAVFNLTLSPASGRTVSVFLSTANGTATSPTDYAATSGVVSFSAGQTSKTFSVTVNGDTSIEADETFVVNLSPIATATFARTQATGTIVDDDTLRLFLDISGPNPNQAAAVDSVLFVRDPFRVPSIGEWWNSGADRNTRVIIFAVNLNPAEPASAVTVSLVDSNSQTHNITSEDVRAVPNSNLTQVRFRLPDTLPAGNCVITIKAHGQTSNAGTIRIAP